MSTGISGWIEVQDATEPEYWDGFIKAGQFMGSNYPLFAYFFGARGGYNFTPIAAGRGLPADLSLEAERDYALQDGFHHATWIGWQEMKDIPWHDVMPGEIKSTMDGQVKIWALEIMLFDMMRQLAEKFGEQRVRLVVWFD